MANLTPTGYVLKTQNDWYAQEKQLYLDIDPKWNLDPSTPDGLKLASDAEIWANLDELGQRAYNSKDPNKAKGNDLEVVCSLTGAKRDLGTASNVVLTLSGVSGTIVSAGQLVESTADGSQWSIDSDVTIGVGGTVDANATCTVNGSTQANVGTLTRIVSTVGGWQSVTNNVTAVPGTNKQSDASLRLERAKTVGRVGNNQVDSMLGELGATTNVRKYKIFENDTGVTDPVTGLPPHSIAPVVDGGTDADVALSIYLKKNPGVTLYAVGTMVQVNVQSPKYPQQFKLITFSRPIYVDIIVNVTIQDDGTLPIDADQLIKEAILQYSTGELIGAECGFNSRGFDIGEYVAISRMYTPINHVIGEYGNSYVTGLTLNGGGVNIPIEFNELSKWTDANITVTINA